MNGWTEAMDHDCFCRRFCCCCFDVVAISWMTWIDKKPSIYSLTHTHTSPSSPFKDRQCKRIFCPHSCSCQKFNWRAVWPDTGIESGPILPKSWPKVAKAVFLFKSDIFHNSPKVGKYLGYFCTIMCCQDRSKVVQTGHTVWGAQNCAISNHIGLLLISFFGKCFWQN